MVDTYCNHFLLFMCLCFSLHSQMYQRQMMMEQQMQQQESSSNQVETVEEFHQPDVNPDAMEVLHVKRKKVQTIQTNFRKATTTSTTHTQSSSSTQSAVMSQTAITSKQTAALVSGSSDTTM